MRILRFIKALVKFIIYGDVVTKDVHDERMSICESCEHRCGTTCCICGCYLKKKTQWSSEHCPKNKW